MRIEVAYKCEGGREVLEVPDLPPELEALPELDVRRLNAEVERLAERLGPDWQQRVASWRVQP